MRPPSMIGDIQSENCLESGRLLTDKGWGIQQRSYAHGGQSDCAFQACRRNGSTCTACKKYYYTRTMVLTKLR
jgi:hypothetical protein